VVAPARRAAFAALLRVTRGERTMDAAVDDVRRSLRDPRDLALLRDLVSGTVRWQGRLDWTLASFVAGSWTRLDPEVLVALRLGAYQLEHLDRVPARAVVDDAVSLVRQARKSSAAGLVNAVLRRFARGERRPLPIAAPDAPLDEVAPALSIAAAHPEWLVRRWLGRESREDVERWLAFDNIPAPMTIRANPLAGGDPATVRARLAAAGVEAEPCRHAPLGLVIVGGPPAVALANEDGAWHVQDEGSQLAALLAPARSGHRVLDLCAAPGGKALAYAAAVGPRGRVVTCDVRPERVSVLWRMLARGRADRAAIVAIAATGTLPFRDGGFDVVAIDAPCSGLGTLRRDPDIKWGREEADLVPLQRLQMDLLRRAARLVAPGGALVYTTCSLEPEETTDVAAAFLAETPAFARVALAEAVPEVLRPFVDRDGCLRLHPVRHGLEGYFGTVFTRR
jgi:16S rRNA (cytosine967-C5)-methyltransferase